MKYYLFRTSACVKDGACKVWAPVLRERFGDDLVVVVDFVAEIGQRNENLAEAFLALASLPRGHSGPVLVELDPAAHTGMKAKRLGEPCEECGGRGYSCGTPDFIGDKAGGRGQTHSFCEACDGGIAWRVEG